MDWNVQYVGRVDEFNAIWLMLKELRLTSSGEIVKKENMQIGQEARGIFQTGMGTSEAIVTRISEEPAL